MDKSPSDGTRITPEQELKLIQRYQENQDPDILDTIVRHRIGWVWTIVKGMKMRKWVDRDSCCADALSEVALRIGQFDISRGKSLSAYLSRIVRRTVLRSAEMQNKQYSCMDFDEVAYNDMGDAGDVLHEIRELVDSIPSDELSGRSIMLISRILSGHSADDIGRIMNWSPEVAKRNVAHIRGYIASKMIERGRSAAPWIDDKELRQIAKVYEDAIRYRL